MEKKSGLWYLLLVILLGFSLVVSGCGKKQEIVKETEIGVNVAEAQTRDIARSVDYSGLVRGKNEVDIMPKVPARVTAVYVKPGDQVRQGQTLLTLDSSDYEAGAKQAEAGLRLAEVKLETAQNNLERIRKLHEAGAVSDQEIENGTTAVDGARAGLDQAEAGLEIAQTHLNNCTVTSPITGTVGSINVSLGDTPDMQVPVAVVSDASQLEIEIMVSESEISYINAGTEVDVHIKAVGDEAFKGIVESVSTVPDAMKHSYGVKIALQNKDNKIKSGMFAEVSVATLNKHDVICVPGSAVVPKGARTVVFTVDKENRARETEVITGIGNERFVEITEGIEKGEKVITKGSTLVKEGTLVRVITGGEK